MDNGLKIQQLIFGEQGLTFVIKRKEDDQCIQFPVSELFCNDYLLAEFNLADIRLISYFAAMEEYQADRIFLKKIKKRRFAKEPL